jgi:hypothetical protein
MRLQAANDLSEVPLLVRLRLLAGIRVPRRYVEWAVSQIKTERWPLRYAFGRLIILWPAALSGIEIVSTAERGPLRMNSAIAIGIVFPVGALLAGLLVGTFWPQWVRDRNISFQTKRRW